MISIPFNITDWQLFNGSAGKNIFTSPGGCIISLWRFNASNQSYERTDYTGGVWAPATGSENFTHLESGRGYWIEAGNSCNLTFFGIVPVYNQTFLLNRSWNVVGHYSAKDPLLYDESVLIPIALDRPLTFDDVILRYNTNTNQFEVTTYFPGWGWFPSFNNQDFIYLNPMLGYYFDMYQNSVWTHDPAKG